MDVVYSEEEKRMNADWSWFYVFVGRSKGGSKVKWTMEDDVAEPVFDSGELENLGS